MVTKSTLGVRQCNASKTKEEKRTPRPRHAYALTAYFRWGKCVCFFFCFSVTSDASCLESLRRMARVCLGRRSRGAYLGEVSIAGRCARSGSHALLALVKQPELGPLVGVDDGEDLGDTLADVVNAGELGVGTSGDLGGPERDQLPWLPSACQPFQFVSRVATYDLSSSSWTLRSSLDLFHSWAVFCSGCKYACERSE
jgi:hypothetical protein